MVLATSMLQVGVDVHRLGLMLVVGQPKNTAEYIQASSRVGRDPATGPGWSSRSGNWARPRDLAHFEQFRHYHETFYAQVEALSVTPFSPTSLERGLDGVLVSAARVMQAHLADGLSPERSAWRIEDQYARGGRPARAGCRRGSWPPPQDEEAADYAQQLLATGSTSGASRRRPMRASQKSLVYERTGTGDQYLPLMISPENAKAHAAGSDRAPFVVANSMREVQPEINLLVSPLPERLFVVEPDNAPQWQLPVEDGKDSTEATA